MFNISYKLISQSTSLLSAPSAFIEMAKVIQAHNPFGLTKKRLFVQHQLRLNPTEKELPSFHITLDTNRKADQLATFYMPRSKLKSRVNDHYRYALNKELLQDFVTQINDNLIEINTCFNHIKQTEDTKALRKKIGERKTQHLVVVTCLLLCPILSQERIYQWASMCVLNKNGEKQTQISQFYFPKTQTSIAVNTNQGTLSLCLYNVQETDCIGNLKRFYKRTNIVYSTLDCDRNTTFIFDHLYNLTIKDIHDIIKKRTLPSLIAFNYPSYKLQLSKPSNYIFYLTYADTERQTQRLKNHFGHFLELLKEIKGYFFENEPDIQTLPSVILTHLSCNITQFRIYPDHITQINTPEIMGSGIAMKGHSNEELRLFQYLNPEQISIEQINTLRRLIQISQNDGIKTTHKIKKTQSKIHIAFSAPSIKITPQIKESLQTQFKVNEVTTRNQEKYLLISYTQDLT